MLKRALPMTSRDVRPMARLCLLLLGLVLACTAAAEDAAKVPPRAARSVHLGYPAPDATAFYQELTIQESTPGSYFMAAGWNTGYFGIQELSDGRKVILFSVWDPTAGDDPSAVRLEERVACLYSAPDVRIRRFGGEGTGGQCLGDFDWKVGETYRFVVSATADGDKTAYAGHVWLNDSRQWKHLVTFQVRTGGQHLRGLYSFVEDFRRDGRSVHDLRHAKFGNGWVLTAAGKWQPLTKARFTASGADWEAKDNIDAGVDNGCFYLATGGQTKMSRPLNSLLQLDESAAREPPKLPQ